MHRANADHLRPRHQALSLTRLLDVKELPRTVTPESSSSDPRGAARGKRAAAKATWTFAQYQRILSALRARAALTLRRGCSPERVTPVASNRSLLWYHQLSKIRRGGYVFISWI